MLQLHGLQGLGIPAIVPERRTPVSHDGPRGRHDRALLDPQNLQADKAVAAAGARFRGERHVAVRGASAALRLAVQRVRAGPAVFRAVVHGASGADGGVPGGERDEDDGVARGAEDEPGGDQLRGVRGVQHGGAVPGGGGEGGAVLRRSVPGGGGHGGGAFQGLQPRRGRRHLVASDPRQAPPAHEVLVR